MSYPRNPVSGRNNRPRELGQTRTQNGRLQYKSPLTNKWEPAVRLETIRADLLRRADPKHYKYAKANGNVYGNDPTNYTAFLPKDRNVGTARAHRPDILFQIYNHNIRYVKPTGYVRHNGRIILDAFDHGLRDFPELPVVLSSELEGSDIEYYYRQNGEIADYDLVARMPNGYMSGKFARKRHDGPPRIGTINQRAQRFRARAACIAWCRREGTRSKNDTILSVIPDQYKDPAVNSTKGFRELTKEEVALVENKYQSKMPSRVKRQKRETLGEDSDDEGNGDWNGDDTSQTDDEWPLTSIGTPQESVENGRARPHPTTSARTLPGQTPLANPSTTIESPEMPSRMTLRSRKPIPPPAPSRDDDSRASVDSSKHTPARRTTIHRETGTKSLPPKAVTETSSPLHEEAESSTTGRKRRHQTDDTAASDDEEFLRRAGPDVNTQTPYINAYLLRRPWLVPDIAPEDLTREALQAHNAWTLSDLRRRRHNARANLGFDPNMDEAFKAETLQGIAAGDYRYMAPKDHGWKEEDKRAISRALELTRIEYCDLKGLSVPGDFAQYSYESYASQWRRIQNDFEKIWTVFSKPKTLYRLPKWRGGFANWKVPKNDAFGKALLGQLEEGERALADMEREFEEEDRLEAEEAARKMSEREGEDA